MIWFQLASRCLTLGANGPLARRVSTGWVCLYIGKQRRYGLATLAYLTLDPEGAVLFSCAENRVPVVREAINDFLKRWNADFPDKNVGVFVTAMDHFFAYLNIRCRWRMNRERILLDIWDQI